MVVDACDPDSAEAQLLVGELSAALAAITGDSGASSFALADVRLARAIFVVARADDGALLGCGALRPLGDEAGAVGAVGEIKRMYARPGTRGVGAALLAHLEAQAARCGWRRAASTCARWRFIARMATSRSTIMAAMRGGPRRSVSASSFNVATGGR